MEQDGVEVSPAAHGTPRVSPTSASAPSSASKVGQNQGYMTIDLNVSVHPVDDSILQNKGGSSDSLIGVVTIELGPPNTEGLAHRVGWVRQELYSKTMAADEG